MSIIMMSAVVLPSLVHTLSPLNSPPKPSKYSKFLSSPEYSAYAASSYVPSYRTYSYFARKPETPSKEILLPSPSIISAASVPFVFGRKGKDKKASVVRGKPIYTKPSAASQSEDSIDWSSDDMQQHPIDEAPRKVCSSVL